MLAPGGIRTTRAERRRVTRDAIDRRDAKIAGQEQISLTQAMNAGKWELLLWLEARGKAASRPR